MFERSIVVRVGRSAVLAVLFGAPAAPAAPGARAHTPARRAAAAPEKAKPEPRSRRAKLTAGRDLMRTAPAAALMDSAWSGALQLGTLVSSRRYDGPQPKGLLAHEATRFLYGTSWTAMLALEAFAVASAGSGDFRLLSSASYRASWLLAGSLPECPARVSLAGCGVGMGGFGSVGVRFKGSVLTYEAGGGWLEQRVSNDTTRTLSESMWVLTPVSVLVPVETAKAPLQLYMIGGPALSFGMHAAHVHPTELGSHTLDVPWHELYPLELGVGPGGALRAGLRIAGRVALEGELAFAIFTLGTRHVSPPPQVSPFGPTEGVPTFRMLSAGVKYADPGTPMDFGVGVFGAELSSRPIGRLGHTGAMIHLRFPLSVDRARPESSR